MTQNESIKDSETKTISSSMNESARKLLDALSSTDNDILRIFTEERNLDEAFLDATMEQIAICYDYHWLIRLIQFRNAYRRANKRTAESKAVEVAKAVLLGQQEQQQRGAWDRFTSIFRGTG
jgi:hypothetical protein